MVDTKETVATKSSVQNGIEEVMQVCRDLMGGTAAMRDAGVRYLPQWPAEEATVYKARLTMSTLFPAYSRTVQTLAAKPLSQPIIYGDDVPVALKEMAEDDIDLQGRNLDAFAGCILESALGYGACGILIDVPKMPKEVAEEVAAGRVLSVAEEAALGVRPYMTHVDLWNIIGWRSERIGGVEKLTQLRLREWVEEPSGMFSMKKVEQIRVLERGSWSIWRKMADKEEWEEVGRGVTSITEIPFVMVYGHKVNFMVSKPPMLEMAYLNVKHWQSQSDQDNIVHVARVPILAVSGIDDETFKLKVGAAAAVTLPMGASMQFVEHSGQALAAGRQGLEDLKEEMRQSGAELLVLQPGQITATQVSSENAVGRCVLQRIAQDTEDALELALQFCADFMRIEEGGSVKLFKDFGAASLAEASTSLLLSMQQTGVLSKATLLKEVQRRGILSPEIEVQAELDAAEADGPPPGTMGEGGAKE